MAVEAALVALAVAVLALGWMRFPMLLLLLAVELVAAAGLSSLFFRERSGVGHFVDTLKLLGLFAFCSIFLLASYMGSGGFARGSGFDPLGYAVLALIATLRLGWIAFSAWRSENRRLHWTREALRNAAALIIAMFLSCFACFIPGVFVAKFFVYLWPDVGADVALGSILLLIHAALVCLLSTMSDEELADISNQPYL